MYQDVVLYPNIMSARAVIKCWPMEEGGKCILEHFFFNCNHIAIRDYQGFDHYKYDIWGLEHGGSIGKQLFDINF